MTAAAFPSLRLLAAVLLASGCAGAARIQVPAELPNTTSELFLTLRWALVREDRMVRAVGTAQSSAGIEWDATLELLGLDAQGRVVSGSQSVVRSGFGPGPTAFEVALVPRGGESAFRLRVFRAWQHERPFR
ncbi:MAG TPA: hypothetical protein VHO73_04910 [Methylomirabilota bacterium]|jgi:hypothetical protein|nr:hypothetical protein [Methylomirabilota bacterium]